jgi:hypothetical protein
MVSYLTVHIPSKQLYVTKPIKRIETLVVIIIRIVIIIPATLAWSWNLVCVLALQIGPNSQNFRKISFHYAHQGTGKTIHSVCQLRLFGTIVDNTPRIFGGKQRLETLDGYIIPLSIHSGFPRMDVFPPTQEELDTCPHVFCTADTEWHPQNVNDKYSVTDLDITDDELQH